MGEDQEKEKAVKDIFRNPLVRFLAYAQEIGNAVNIFSPHGICKYLPYFPGVTHTYIVMDTIAKGHEAFMAREQKEEPKEDKPKDEKPKEEDPKKKNAGPPPDEKDEKPEKPKPKPKPPPILMALDRYGWHMLASIIFPKYTLTQVHCGLEIFANFLKLAKPFRTYMTTALAVATIPIIIKPIDALSDHVMDMSYRKVFGTGEDKGEEEKPDDDDVKPEDEKKMRR